MKIIFLGAKQDSREHEVEVLELDQMFKLGEQVSDMALEKIERTIDKFPETHPCKERISVTDTNKS